MKLRVYVFGIATIVVLLIGQVLKMSFKDCGISKLKTYSDIRKLNCNVEYIFGEDEEDEQSIYDSLAKYENDYVSGVKQADIIIVGVGTGKYNQQAGSFCQEVKVDSVIKGDNIHQNDVINIYGTDGFEVKNKVTPYYTNSQNIIMAGNKYLIFLNNIEVNKFRKDKNSYRLEGSYFCYLKLDKQSDHTISTIDSKVQFNDLQKLEYFTTSERILKQIQKIKEKIIKDTINT